MLYMLYIVGESYERKILLSSVTWRMQMAIKDLAGNVGDTKCRQEHSRCSLTQDVATQDMSATCDCHTSTL